ncbi:MAG: hypothetical protein PHT23_04965 [Bacteroidales bacterium]|nr:hypothetical protein [Bacteroidales bacterium]
MSKRKLTKKELRERQVIDGKQLKRTLLVSFGLFFVLAIFYNVFIVFGHDTKYAYRKYALYGKQVPAELVCMDGDKLIYHKSIKLSYNGKNYFFCSQDCYDYFVNHFQKNAFIPDSFSGDNICKADALIGLRNRGEPEIVYFQNRKTFDQYYKSRK